LEKSGSSTLIIGRFSIGNRAEAAKVVSFFPQASSRRGEAITQSRRTTMVTGSSMWMMAQYLLYRHHTYTNFVNSPHVKPPWR
jgi:hypothetical protein